MNEVGWCYLEGFGCKKDKVSHLITTSLSYDIVKTPRFVIIHPITTSKIAIFDQATGHNPMRLRPTVRKGSR